MIDFIPHRCPSYLYKRAGCRLCVESCPERCMEFKDNAVLIKEEQCNSCGICTAACPSGALILHGFNDRDLWGRLRNITKDREYIVFTCSSGENFKPAKFKKGSCLIALPCIGTLKDSHLIGLFRYGAKEVWLSPSCKECLSIEGRRVLIQTAGHAGNLLKSLCIDGTIVISEDLPAVDKGKEIKPAVILPAPHYSRRGFLTMFKNMAETIYRTALDEDKENTPLPDAGIPEKRQLLIEILEGFVKTVKPILKGEFSIYRIGINDNCTLCNICGLFCPTGALKRIEDEEKVRIDFRISSCVGCFQCEELCPDKALYSLNTIDFKSFLDREIKTLYQKEMVICPECENPYLPIAGSDICISCRKKKDMEKGFFEMMGIGGYGNE